MQRSWFIWENGKVDGPLSLEAIEAGLGQNKWPNSALIWFRGQKDWVTLSSWAAHLPAIKERLAQEKDQAWYCKLAGQTVGPLPLKDVAQMLRSQPDFKNARLWSPTLKSWTPVYQLAEFGELLDFHVRLLARAPITGDVEIHLADSTYSGRLDSVSERGIHVSSAFKHDDPNKALHLTVRSLALPKELRVTGRALYRTKTGFGFRFGHLSNADRSTLQDYILQYQDSPELRPATQVSPLENQNDPSDRWYIANGTKLAGPHTASKTVELLRGQSDLSSTMVKSLESGVWVSPFENEVIAAGLGVERRRAERVPVVGLLCFTGSKTGQAFETLTLSEQGISIMNAGALEIGQQFDVVLKVKKLGQPVRARVIVRYKSPKGDVGLSFDKLPSADLEKISSFVNQNAA